MIRVVIRDLDKFPGLQPISIVLLYPGSHSFLLQFIEENVQFRERESYFSLDFPSFGPSVRFGPRSKAVLRGKGYA